MFLESDIMDEVKATIKDIPFYYELLNIHKINKTYHIVYIDSESFKLFIPNNYSINYSKSNNNYNKGHLSFYNHKYTYTFDYHKMTYNQFTNKIDSINGEVIKSFINYRGQEVYEIVNNNVDYLYMYYNGYFYRLYSNHKFTINEYFDMYFVLFSITSRAVLECLNHLLCLYFIQDQGLYYLCNDLDVLQMDLSDYHDSVNISKDDLIILNDDDYLEYKKAQQKAQSIALKVLEPKRDALSLYRKGNVWYIFGSFSFGVLGKYNYGYIDEFNEISGSEELSLEEKKDLLNKMIKQKQLEVISYYPKIKDEFYKYLVDYFINNLTYQLWSEYHLREFINLYHIIDDEMSVPDTIIYNSFMDKLQDVDDYLELFNQDSILNSIICEKIVIYPNRYIVKFSALNCLFNEKEFTFDETYKLCCNYC